jgi:hypothetical protein
MLEHADEQPAASSQTATNKTKNARRMKNLVSKRSAHDTACAYPVD